MLSGPCALGLALNNAVGNEPLAKFTPGLLTRDGYNRKKLNGLDSDAIGNVMILSVCLVIQLCVIFFLRSSILSAFFVIRLIKMTWEHLDSVTLNEMSLSHQLIYQVSRRFPWHTRVMVIL